MKAKQLLLAAIHPRLPIEGKLPPLGGATGWLNSQPLTAAGLRGKVVLVDFWTYTCINWLRQLPYVRAWAEKYKDQGLVVLGFPSNDFAQERGSNQEIAEFCENTFGVKFPMFAKSSVRGSDANPLFRELAARTGQAPRWNFHKYLVGRDGHIADVFPERVEPTDTRVITAIARQLDGAPKVSN